MGRRAGNVMQAKTVVRHHIVQVCLEHCGEKIKLPSAKEYAAKLDFSLRTIAAEMALLVKEGWIIGQRGIGYFTNPEFNKDYDRKRRLTGLITGDSLYLEYDFNQWSFLAEAGLAITKRMMTFVRPLHICEHDTDRFYKRLLLEDLDALVWVLPEDEMDCVLKKFAESGHPVISLLKKIPQLSCVTIDWKLGGYAIAEKANRKNLTPKAPILWYTGHDSINIKQMNAFQEKYQGDNPLIPFGLHTEMIRYLHSMLGKGERPAMLISHSFVTKSLYEEFLNSSTDPWNNILWVGDTYNLPLIPGYRGLGFSYPHKEIAEAVADLLAEQFAGKPPRTILIEKNITEFN